MAKRTFRDKVCNVFSNITLEPSFFLFLVCSMIIDTAKQNLILEKACRVNLNYSAAECDALMAQQLDSENEIERESQKLYSKAVSWNTYITTPLPCILILFIGAFSDQTGYRKCFIIMSLCGQTLSGINTLINVFLLNELRLEFFVFSEAVIQGVAGSWIITVTAIAFISAITTDENRTSRLGLITFSNQSAFPVGMLMGGFLLKRFGYYAPAVEILSGTATLALRAIITKMVESQEIGKVSSAIVLMEIMTPLIYIPVYTKVYSSTIETLTGAVFLLSAIMSVPAVLVLVLSWMFYRHRRYLRKSKPAIEEDYNR